MTNQKLKLALATIVTVTSTMGLAQSNVSTSSTSTTAAKADKKIGVSLSNETSKDLYSASRTGGAGTKNTLSLTYKVQEDLKFGASLINKYNIPAKGEKNENAAFQDFQLFATKTHGGFLGTEKTPIKYSVLLPTSQDSRDAKQVFGVRGDIVLDYELGEKLTSQIIETPILGFKPGSDVFKNAIVGEIRKANTKVISTYAFFIHLLKSEIGKKFEKTSESLSLGAGVDAAPNENVTLGLALSRDRELFKSADKNPNKNFNLGDLKEISYTFTAAVTY